MFQIGICDDEPLAIEYLTLFLEKWSKEKGCELSITAFASAEQFLFEYEENKNYDMLFLDIQMGEMNGMELAKKIRLDNKNVQIVFLTALTDYVLDGYEVSALHYLVKPLDEEKLASVMERASAGRKEAERFLLLEIDQTMTRVPVSRIIYAEAFSHYIRITTKDGVCEMREKISALAEQLGTDFLQPHRSYLVNLRYIYRISKTEILLDNGMAIPLSRYNYQKINQAFITYYKGKMEHGTL